MNGREWLQLAVYFGALGILAPLLGRFLAAVFTGAVPEWMRPLKIVEDWAYRLAGCSPEKEMRWTQYAVALLWFNLAGLLAILGLQLTQQWLPLNPARLPNVPWSLALNTAVSFVTNTNWQAYSGEATLSYLTQMLGLTVQNFVSAATGMAVLLALARGVARKSASTLGNFWSDLVRCTLYVLAPAFPGVCPGACCARCRANVRLLVEITTLEGVKQFVPLGPAASQIAIKQLGTNGGGFFGVNSAHPFENPTPLTNFLQMLAILLLPAAQVFMFGHYDPLAETRLGFVRRDAPAACSPRWALRYGRSAGEIRFSRASRLMEGKETRFGVVN